MKYSTKNLSKIPSTPGVYTFFSKDNSILYIGKAACLKSRVKSYFRKNLAFERPIEFVMEKVKRIEIQKTSTVIEAFFLEQELIKKFKPKYNVIGKDDKSFSFLIVTKEDFPRFEIVRKTDLEKISKKTYSRIYGPFSSRYQLRIALRILQKIFPFHRHKEKSEKKCLDFQIGLCPGPYGGKITKQNYSDNIKSIEMFLKGKKKNLIKKLEKEMKIFSEKQNFEKATEKRNQLFALQHIQDIALINKEKKIISKDSKSYRIEGYDISNISGKFSVGSMVVFSGPLSDLQPEKSQYRKFKIKTVQKTDDVGSMREVLTRRFKNDWPLPDLILLDGGKGHYNMAKKLLESLKLDIPLLAVAKGPKRKKLDLHPKNPALKIPLESITQIRDESHRFAINYHRKLRENNFK